MAKPGYIDGGHIKSGQKAWKHKIKNSSLRIHHAAGKADDRNATEICKYKHRARKQLFYGEITALN